MAQMLQILKVVRPQFVRNPVKDDICFYFTCHSCWGNDEATKTSANKVTNNSLRLPPYLLDGSESRDWVPGTSQVWRHRNWNVSKSARDQRVASIHPREVQIEKSLFQIVQWWRQGCTNSSCRDFCVIPCFRFHQIISCSWWNGSRQRPGEWICSSTNVQRCCDFLLSFIINMLNSIRLKQPSLCWMTYSVICARVFALLSRQPLFTHSIRLISSRNIRWTAGLLQIPRWMCEKAYTF